MEVSGVGVIILCGQRCNLISIYSEMSLLEKKALACLFSSFMATFGAFQIL